MRELAMPAPLALVLAVAIFSAGFAWATVPAAPATVTRADLQAAELHLSQRLERIERGIYRLEQGK